MEPRDWAFAQAVFADLAREVREYTRLRAEVEATAREAVSTRRRIRQTLDRLEWEVPIDHTPQGRRRRPD